MIADVLDERRPETELLKLSDGLLPRGLLKGSQSRGCAGMVAGGEGIVDLSPEVPFSADGGDRERVRRVDRLVAGCGVEGSVSNRPCDGSPQVSPRAR